MNLSNRLRVKLAARLLRGAGIKPVFEVRSRARSERIVRGKRIYVTGVAKIALQAIDRVAIRHGCRENVLSMYAEIETNDSLHLIPPPREQTEIPLTEKDRATKTIPPDAVRAEEDPDSAINRTDHDCNSLGPAKAADDGAFRPSCTICGEPNPPGAGNE